MYYNFQSQIIDFESIMCDRLSTEAFNNICDSTELIFNHNDRMYIFYMRYFDKRNTRICENDDSNDAFYMGALIQYKNRYIHLRNVEKLRSFILAEHNSNRTGHEFLVELDWLERYNNTCDKLHYISSLDLDTSEYYVRPIEIEFYIDPYKNEMDKHLFNCDDLAKNMLQLFYRCIFIPLVNDYQLRIGTSLNIRNRSEIYINL